MHSADPSEWLDDYAQMLYDIELINQANDELATIQGADE